MRIALVAPLAEAVPPKLYGGFFVCERYSSIRQFPAAGRWIRLIDPASQIRWTIVQPEHRISADTNIVLFSRTSLFLSPKGPAQLAFCGFQFPFSVGAPPSDRGTALTAKARCQ